MKNILLLMINFLILANLSATDLTISEPILYTDNDQSYAVLNINWKNAWNTNKNHDAVWLFFKFLRGSDGYHHAKINNEGHELVSNHLKQVNLGFEVPEDKMGLFFYPTVSFRGDIHATIKIQLDNASFEVVDTRASYFKVYGIEMVHIPTGGYTLGDGGEQAIDFGSLYLSDENGKSKGLYKVTDENQAITIAPKKDQLFYQASEGNEGDQQGTISANFPKGVNPFYIMKYEPTQEQYASFLNSLSENQSQNRVNFGGKNYYENYGSIYKQGDRYVAENPDASCNYMSWDDAMAYADWAGLRPMTELEFVKASRGPEKPKAGEFPWGTSDKMKMQRFLTENGTMRMLNGWDESMLTDDNRSVFGASYYWVMDLAGGLWERVITIGHPKGREFTGLHGDGNLTNYGYSDIENWPDGMRSGGFGYRGGGFYGYGRDYHDYNPYSPISYRPYGAWAGGNRSKAYGARFVRTASEK